MTTSYHLNIHPHLCPVNLLARRNNNFYTSAFQPSHPPVECVRWAAPWRGLFWCKRSDPLCMWCSGCPHVSISGNKQCFSLHLHQNNPINIETFLHCKYESSWLNSDTGVLRCNDTYLRAPAHANVHLLTSVHFQGPCLAPQNSNACTKLQIETTEHILHEHADDEKQYQIITH